MDMDIKNAKNEAKTIKLCSNEGTRTYLKRKLKVLGLNVTKGPNCKETHYCGRTYLQI
jgi:hypothetical protein